MIRDRREALCKVPSAVRRAIGAAVLGLLVPGSAPLGAFQDPGPGRPPIGKHVDDDKKRDRVRAVEPAAAEPRRAASVEAPVLEWIEIDGDLSDWPAAMPRYSVRTVLPGGSHSTERPRGDDLTTSPDLSACFMVGYDPRKQVVYVAVIVRDDELVVGHKSHLDTDAVEIYVDGLHSKRTVDRPQPEPWFKKITVADLPVQQYVGIPGKAPVYGMDSRNNPMLVAGDTSKTRTRLATRRTRGVTTYEWAIQVFDRYPDRLTRLEPGKVIGFDMIVVDKDVPVPPEADFIPAPGTPLAEPGEDRTVVLLWSPIWRGMKVLDAGSLGEITLGR